MADKLFESVSNPDITISERIENLKTYFNEYKNGKLQFPAPKHYVNNHIHTIYSFSPYSPASAALAAWQNGLTTAGIMDHDSLAGAEEFIEAGKILGIATTIGFECRCRVDNSPFEGKRLNNPDQNSVAYVACHGIPHQNIEAVQQWLAPYREKRNIRNRKMVNSINNILAKSGVQLDFENDVVPLSQSKNGGSITERHILYALSFKITAHCGRGMPVVNFLGNFLNINPTGNNLNTLQNPDSSSYEYALLNVLKSNMVEQFYVNATDECPHITEFVAFAKSIGAIPAYAYLGDVESSVTGDKKAQTFEDAFLDELVEWLAEIGFSALTYMPTRNTPQQLKHVMALCTKHGLFQISGEDINSPTQSFICKALDLPEYKHLINNTWALIGHEKAASKDINNGMFSIKTINENPCLKSRIEKFKLLGISGT